MLPMHQQLLCPNVSLYASVTPTVWHPRLSELWPVRSPAGQLPSSSAAVSAGRTTSPADPPYGPGWNLQVSPGTYWIPTHTKSSQSLGQWLSHLTIHFLGRHACIQVVLHLQGIYGIRLYAEKVSWEVSGYSRITAEAHLNSQSPIKLKITPINNNINIRGQPQGDS